MKKIIAAILLGSLSLPIVPSQALACGGPAMDDIDNPLQPPDKLLQWLTVVPCDTESACYFIDDLPTAPELLFLQPFRLSRPKEIADLWKYSYEFNGTTDEKGNDTEYQPPAPLSVASLQSFLQNGNFEQAVEEAKSLFEKIMNLPAGLAQSNHDAFVESLEVLELRPLFGKIPAEDLERYFSLSHPPYWPAFMPLSDPTLPAPLKEALLVLNLRRDRAESLARNQPDHPRLGTLKFIALQEAMRTQIPDGYREEIQKKMTPDAWKGLEALADQWLKDFPENPLADLVRLTKLRLYYLQGDDKKAWQTVLDVYARRPIRALAEMRFLLKQGVNPSFQDVPSDPVLMAALAPWFEDPDGKIWTQLWRLSEANASAPWAINLQERLLKQVSGLAQKGKPLPEGFPDVAKNPTQTWGRFRLFALYKAGQYDRALAQAESLKPNLFSQSLQAKLYLVRKEWAKIMALEKLPMDSKRYLIRVLMDDDALHSIADVPNPEIQSEVKLALAVHMASKGDWKGGAALVDSPRANLWNQAALLSANQSPEGLLAWARFLRKNDGKLFYEPDTVWYRSLFSRLLGLEYELNTPPTSPADRYWDASLPWTVGQEQQKLIDHFTSLEPYLALKAYGAWLNQADAKNTQTKTVLKEADRTYNWMVNWANNYSDGWKAFLDKSPEAQIIRKAGSGAK